MKISVLVTAKNSARTIEKCLSSLSFANEIILVDSGSTDDTVSIAEELGATVYHQQWLGYGPQKNFGASKAQGDWLLFIDSDEEVTPELQLAIIKTIENPKFNIYWIRIVTIFLNKPLNHLFGHNARLFKKTSGRWTNAKVHEQVEDETGITTTLGDNLSGIIKEPLLHHSHQTIRSYLKKMHHYTTLDAQQMSITGHHRSGKPLRPTIILPIKLAAKQFIKLLFYRQGILDGYAGVTWAILSSYYEYEMTKKYLAQQRPL